MAVNPLLRDRDVDFLLHEVLAVGELCALPGFREHSPETFTMYLDAARRVARQVLWPAYRAMDAEPPRFVDGGIRLHPKMREIYAQLTAMELAIATRPVEVGGQALPLTVAAMGHAYLMAANLSAYGLIGLTSGAAHLIEAFGSDWLKREFMARMYRGEWTGTMALTEPQAGSSLTDVKSRATPRGDGTFRVRGSKIFISGGDHDLTENIVHLTLARIDGAPAGIKGVSLFAIPKKRFEGDQLVSNDVQVAGMIHKIGWRGLPSLAMEFGERDDCHAWLVGEPHRGITYMFQLMNEARIMVGLNGVATASVAYHESVEYAQTRSQGRPLTAKNPAAPQVPIVEHADVRRMLLRQKAIVEGGLALLATTARYADLAAHAEREDERHRAALLLDLLTPVAKSFPAEWGYQSNVLALQIHGGYGYSSEFLVEAWLRDQKLNSIHEGTTGIQAMDLLGRKVVAQGGEPLRLFGAEIAATVAGAIEAGLDGAPLQQAFDALAQVTMRLGALGLGGDVDGMMRHATDYLEAFAILAVAWQWLEMATVAARADRAGADDFYAGKRCAADYWLATELPRVPQLCVLCAANDDSYARLRPGWL